MRVEIRGLEQGYGPVSVLDDISFDAESGEILTILGPNGSGKSTFIKTFCRIMEPRSGSINIDGRDIFGIPKEEYAKIVGYVPQNAEFIGYSTVYDAVLIGRRPHVKWSYSKNDISIAVQAMKDMKISHYFNRQVTELSGGQRQRVTIARALTQDPQIYVFDEPTSALDLRHQLDTLKYMREIIKKKGSCMIIALHDLNLALRYSDKVVALKDGKVYDFGKADEVITEKMVSDVYGVESEIVETSRGKYIHAFDSEIDELQSECNNTV